MRIIFTAIIFCIFLPFLTFALELSSSPKVSLPDNIFNSLRSAPSRIESYITSESAKEKGFWLWVQGASGELFSRAIRAASNIGEFAKNKGRSTFNFIGLKIKEKISENIWSSGKVYIKNSINYINKKIQN